MYPISLHVRGRRAVVVGGGPVAERKIRGLLEARAEVLVVARSCTSGIREEADRGALQLRLRAFAPEDLEGAFLVFAATDDDALNAHITDLAHQKGILVNDAADATRGDFVTPAVHRAGNLTFAVETAGASPALAMRLREELQQRYDERYARATTLLAHMRDYADIITDQEVRARATRELTLRPIEELATMTPTQAEHLIDETVQAEREPTPPNEYICATRSSALALWQARSVMAKLAGAHIASTLLPISTKGDRVQDRPLDALGSDGVFIKELEHALREHRADYAVHSCKDLPSTLPDDMRLAAIGMREDPRDAFCSERHPSFEALPSGAVVGTSSPRRRAQLQALRRDLQYVDMRGNIDTRLRKLRDGEYDAIILAMAGLRRLKLRSNYLAPLDIELMIPAAGQGALAVECRKDDQRTARVLRAALSDPAVEIAVLAERAFLRRLRAGCQAPVGAHAVREGEMLTLHGVIAEPDGSHIVRGKKSVRVRMEDPGTEDVSVAEQLGETLADELSGPLRHLTFLLPRTQERPSRIAPALRGVGALVIEVTGSEQARSRLERVPDVLLFPSSGSVARITEYLNDVRSRGAHPIVAAMGEASAAAARAQGFTVHVTAPNASIASFVQSITEFLLTTTKADE